MGNDPHGVGDEIIIEQTIDAMVAHFAWFMDDVPDVGEFLQMCEIADEMNRR
jgi:hypothetical protein